MTDLKPIREAAERELGFWKLKQAEGDDRYPKRTCVAHIRNIESALSHLDAIENQTCTCEPYIEPVAGGKVSHLCDYCDARHMEKATTDRDVAALLEEARRTVAPVVAKERECEKIDAETMNFRMGDSHLTEQPVELPVVKESLTSASQGTDARKAKLEAITADSICDDLMKACNGHPHAKIAWPHYLLHNAHYFIQKQQREIDRLPKREVGSHVPASHQLKDEIANNAALLIKGMGPSLTNKECYERVQRILELYEESGA